MATVAIAAARCRPSSKGWRTHPHRIPARRPDQPGCPGCVAGDHVRADRGGQPDRERLRVVARHEQRGRGYYAGVLALLGRDASGAATLDAPILIRTAEILADGQLRVPVGATLVRGSTPSSEVAETYAKAAVCCPRWVWGPLFRSAVRVLPGRRPGSAVSSGTAKRHAGPVLAGRPALRAAGPTPSGRRVLVVDAEDTFTGMLAHLLRSLGMVVSVRPVASVRHTRGYDVVVAGPGPGSPSSVSEPRIVALRQVVSSALASGLPLLVCVSGIRCWLRSWSSALPQVRSLTKGSAVDRLLRPAERVGFYSTFSARSSADAFSSAFGPVRVARDPGTGMSRRCGGGRSPGAVPSGVGADRARRGPRPGTGDGAVPAAHSCVDTTERQL